ncbi:hypothetical protein DFH09DRAFT_1072512 [Mycena vulgaris]|nr:hypothetical protein DFH09DRAFT_1072512 [Mycena vulgaris]
MSMLVGLDACRNVAEGFIRGGQPGNTRFKGLDHLRTAILCRVEASRTNSGWQESHSVDGGRTVGGWGDDGGGKESTFTLDGVTLPFERALSAVFHGHVPIEEPLEVKL